jgi:hypothetical protein
MIVKSKPPLCTLRKTRFERLEIEGGSLTGVYGSLSTVDARRPFKIEVCVGVKCLGKGRT